MNTNSPNKANMIEFFKILVLIVLAFLVIIPNAEVWNCSYLGYTDGFHVWVSVLDFIVEGGLVYWFAKKVLLKKD